MVSTKLYGGLGNRLYMSAAVIGYAIKHGIEWSLKPDNQKADVWISEAWNYKQHYQELAFKEEWAAKRIVLHGYWQSYKYFDHCKSEVLKAFEFPYQKKEGYCSIHVRRGDYLHHPTKHPVVTEKYLNAAISLMQQNAGTDIKFKWFSDDISWCKVFVDRIYTNSGHEFSEGKPDVEDLSEMSCCQHNIGSNSTMSLWSAELNQNPDKIVIVPHENNWFGKDKPLSVKDLFRPEWIKIKY